jgi:serine/threonine protein kinase
MAKADASWAQEQTRQVITEIESLKQIRHPNVMKLYAYNLNAKYPTKEKEKIDCILLVLEYAPGGELFDILYYTSALESHVARTYFRQFIAGLEACHNAGVAHRDLKPQNLLLDAKFNLKITDFGLSKVFESDADTIMKTTYVGTRGYQAPELLLNKRYDLACDIFSAGVVLFILLTGYPPFEQASKNDRWFRPLTKENHKKFWELHAGCPISQDEKVKELLQRMLAFDPKKRITIAEIKEHEWFNGKFLEGKELIRTLRDRHRQMESKRRKDARKLKDLQNSITKTRDIPGMEEAPITVDVFPSHEVEGIYDTHTTAEWKDVYNTIYDVVGGISGVADFDFDRKVLTCSVKLQNQNLQQFSLVKFEVQCYQSREFIKEPDSDEESDKDAKPEIVYVVRFRRLEGSVLDWKKVLQQVLYQKCASVLTGLPKWARQQMNKAQVEVVDDDEDDYDKILAKDQDLTMGFEDDSKEQEA